jgi:RNA polymerase sigma-70 factor (ECF subfamily)
LVHASVRAHLFTAVRHRALHWHRRTRLEARHALSMADALAMDVTVAPPPDQAVEWNDVVRIVRAAIAALPPRTREAYVLHRQDTLTYAEVGQIMGTSVKTVEKQVAAALRALRAALAVLQE